MEWFKVYGNLKDHPKRWRFEAKAGTEYGLHYLTAFWCYVCRYAEDGDLSGVGDAELARACEWKGEPSIFWDSLVHAGFVDVDGDTVTVHDWAEIHERFLNENARRKKPKGYPRVTQGAPVLEEKRIEEKRKTTPKAASAAWEACADFVRFWQTWPRSSRKGSPVEAYKAWLKAEPPIDKVLACLAWKKKSEDWAPREGKDFIPMPSTWLNNSRWLEEDPNAHKNNFKHIVRQKPEDDGPMPF